MLRIENVTKKYDGQAAIENVSFSVKKGTACGVVGYNGAGKTTLLKTICDALIPDAGGGSSTFCRKGSRRTICGGRCHK